VERLSKLFIYLFTIHFEARKFCCILYIWHDGIMFTF